MVTSMMIPKNWYTPIFFFVHYKNVCEAFKSIRPVQFALWRKMLKLLIACFQLISRGMNRSDCIFKAIVTFDIVVNDFSSGYFKHELRKYPLKLISICFWLSFYSSSTVFDTYSVPKKMISLRRLVLLSIESSVYNFVKQIIISACLPNKGDFNIIVYSQCLFCASFWALRGWCVVTPVKITVVSISGVSLESLRLTCLWFYPFMRY